jgi:ArsR family transcriptional regulator, arsenate/arsenite/antimonite-responsive transcriptional repressor
MNVSLISHIFKSLSDPTRLKICLYLQHHGESPCTEILKEFKLAQPTMSHHFAKLIEAGVVRKRKEHLSNYYSLNQETLQKVGLNLHQMGGLND